jgi:hypothetical protein
VNLERANWTLKSGRDWHVAWYHECLRIIDRFTHQEGRWNSNMGSDSQVMTNTNLCHYVRCAAAWGPLILLGQLVMWASIFLATIYLPISRWGGPGYLAFWAFVVAFGGLVYGAYLVLDSQAGDWMDDHMMEPTRRASNWVKEGFLFRNSKGVSLWSMVWDFIVTLKHQICPVVQIEEED